MATIFISHSSKDSATAAEFNRRLEVQGHRSVFLDFDPEMGIPPGLNWELELYRQLRVCQVVIVLCSEYSMSSRWCFAEITHAKSLGKYVFPVKVSPCTIDPVLTSSQIIDLTKNHEEAYQRLWRGLKVAGVDPVESFDWDSSRSPYPGMMAFQQEDAAVFFGREAEIQQFLETLQFMRQFGGARMLLVLGASGSGKSSLVRAGLLPRLRRNPENWLIIDPFRPIDHPLRELAIVLAQAFSYSGQSKDWKDICKQLEQAARSEKYQKRAILNDLAVDLQIACKQRAATTLLIIDQAEELFEHPDKERTLSLLSLLSCGLQTPNSSLMVIFILRSDFMDDFQSNKELRGLALENISVRPIATEHVTRIIKGPADTAGIQIEDGLTETMVRDTERQDALPLLAFTLRELYEHCGNDKRFEVREYREKLGGLSGAVARVAEAVLSATQLSTDKEQALRNALVSLVRINEEGQFTRQPARWSDLPESVHGFLERFVKARLLTSWEDGKERLLEVAHEALFNSWKRLKNWLDEDREFLLWRKRFKEAWQLWLRTERAPDALLTGHALREGHGWLGRRGEQFTPGEIEYLNLSVSLAKKRRNRRRRFIRNLLLMCIAFTIIFLGAVSLILHELRELNNISWQIVTKNYVISDLSKKMLISLLSMEENQKKYWLLKKQDYLFFLSDAQQEFDQSLRMIMSLKVQDLYLSPIWEQLFTEHLKFSKPREVDLSGINDFDQIEWIPEEVINNWIEQISQARVENQIEVEESQVRINIHSKNAKKYGYVGAVISIILSILGILAIMLENRDGSTDRTQAFKSANISNNPQDN